MDNAIETRLCPHCGTPNAESNALCENCKSPLTAYAGQLRGQDNELADSRLAQHVARLEARPLAVPLLTGLIAIFALAWPVGAILNSFRSRAALNAEGSNYLAASFSSVGPIFTTMMMLPVLLGLLFVIFGIWAQRNWAWSVTVGLLVIIALVAVIAFAPVFKLLWLVMVAASAYFWFRPETKAWYGYS